MCLTLARLRLIVIKHLEDDELSTNRKKIKELKGCIIICALIR
ncbi:hypothetical protein NC651_040215 [Populus alba x Populus x berolinensis]|nr:hypothetical protein NC651_040215 [Populus alba x Populus x berolinensis]